MKEITDTFWNASVEEIKRGYIFDSATEEYVCLVCGRRFEKGVIYSEGDVLYAAEKYVRIHIAQEHISMFHYLLSMSKKYSGLTDLQKNLLRHFYEGFSDKEIAEKLEIGSTSTVRNHRFALREKEKQAKVYLAIMELLGIAMERPKCSTARPTAAIVDGRLAVTEEETSKILQTYFPEGLDGPLSGFPTKEKRKIIILNGIINRFAADRTYTEKEVNEILQEVFHDYVLIRRNLIDYNLMDRAADGSAYWVKKQEKEMKNVNRAELKQQYKEMKRPMGILQITNQANGKVFIASGQSLNGLVNKHQFQLKMNSHMNKELQKDWNEFGAANFTFEIVETLDPSNEPGHDDLADLKALEEMWLDKVQPYGDKGYNRR